MTLEEARKVLRQQAEAIAKQGPLATVDGRIHMALVVVLAHVDEDRA